MTEKPSFYAVLPADVRYSDQLSSLQKLLYAEITALTNKEGYCFASNAYFAKLYQKSITRVSLSISDMEKKGFILIEINRGKGNERRIFIGKITKTKKTLSIPTKSKLDPIGEKDNTIKEKLNRGIEEKLNSPIKENLKRGIKENLKHNITSNNTTSNNTLLSKDSSIQEGEKKEKSSDKKIIDSLKKIVKEKEKSSAKKEKEKSSAKKEKENPEKIEYGNLEINEAMDLIKSFNGGIINGSTGKQRQFANHLIKKLKKIDSVEQGRFTRQTTLETILKIISNNPYHAPKIASPELIYRNLASLMQVCKTEFGKQSRSLKTV